MKVFLFRHHYNRDVVARLKEFLHEVADALSGLSFDGLLGVGVHINAVITVSVYHAEPVVVCLALVVDILQHDLSINIEASPCAPTE